MDKTLVIIDMQPEFCASKILIENVKNEIKKAIRLQIPVVLVEYGGDEADLFRILRGENPGISQTYPEIKQLLRGYKYFAKTVKKVDDGSKNILESCKRRKFPTDHLLICGINTCACVFVTVKGLLQKLPQAKIELVKAGCGCNCSNFDRNCHGKVVKYINFIKKTWENCHPSLRKYL